MTITTTMNRRHFLATAATSSLASMLPWNLPARPSRQPSVYAEAHIRFSVNAYSFNAQLRAGKMTLSDMMEFAAEAGFDAVDLTGYYLPGYPEAPADEALFALKRKAFSLGLAISWAGTRSNFVVPDAQARARDLAHVQQWVEVASKLGAPILRVFAGKGPYDGHPKSDAMGWLIESLQACAEQGERHGVIIGLQNHLDFLFTTAEIIEVLEGVKSDWLALNLDMGSLRDDVYGEIEQLMPYAAYCFIKEQVIVGGQKVAVDFHRIAAILKRTHYQGFVAVEALKPGDPRQEVQQLLHGITQALNS